MLFSASLDNVQNVGYIQHHNSEHFKDVLYCIRHPPIIIGKLAKINVWFQIPYCCNCNNGTVHVNGFKTDIVDIPCRIEFPFLATTLKKK